MIYIDTFNRTCKVFYVILIIIFLSLSFVYAEQPDAKNLETENIESFSNDSVAENVNNTMGNEELPAETENLFETVKQGGPLMIFIVMLGLVSLTITIERIIHYTRKGVWKNDELEKILNDSADASSASYREDLEDELRSVFFVYQNDLEKGLPLLSGIGNLSPIVGFLGTVIGMISAFAAIAAATTVNAKVVAVGIQIALVTTAGGLLVAAPSLFFFYIFTHVIQNRYTTAENIISERSSVLPRLSTTIEKEDIE